MHEMKSSADFVAVGLTVGQFGDDCQLMIKSKTAIPVAFYNANDVGILEDNPEGHRFLNEKLRDVLPHGHAVFIFADVSKPECAKIAISLAKALQGLDFTQIIACITGRDVGNATIEAKKELSQYVSALGFYTHGRKKEATVITISDAVTDILLALRNNPNTRINIVDYSTWQVPMEVCEEYADELKAFNEWAERSRNRKGIT